AHGRGEARGNGFLPEGEVAGALYEILQEEIIGALLAAANLDLQAIELEPLLESDIVIGDGVLRCHEHHTSCDFTHSISLVTYSTISPVFSSSGRTSQVYVSISS